MSLIKLYKLLIIVLTLAFSTYSQNDEPRFIQLPLDKGIALNLTYDMIQDSKGFLWFGTMYGLVRYDGENFVTYKYNPNDTTSISFDDIISITEDSKGNLWIGTWGGGLNLFDINTRNFTRFIHKTDDLNSVAENIIWSIAEDENGIMWIGTDSQGLQMYVPSTGLFTNVDAGLLDSTEVYPSIQSLFADYDFLWIGDRKGLSRLNLQTEEVFHYDLKDSNEKTSRNSLVNSIYKDSKGNLWIGTTAGLKKYNEEEDKFIQPIPELKLNITSITEDLSGNLWLGSSNGLIRLDENNEVENFTSNNTENSLAGNFVNRVLIDHSGILWTSSYNSGITKVILTPSNFKLVPETQNNIRAVTGDENGNIYVGTYRNKITVYNPLDNKISSINFPDNKNYAVHSLVVNKNTFWIGTNSTIFKYDLTKKRFDKNPFTKEQQGEIERKGITTLCFDSNNILWMGTYNQGIYSFDSENGTLKSYLPAGERKKNHANFILTIYADSENNIWVGTYGGVHRFDPATGKFESYVQKPDKPNDLSNNYVYSIYEDPDGKFWFGTASGLNKFDPESESFTKFYQRDGLPSDVIFGIADANDGNLWLSTNKGLSRFNVDNQSFQNFDKEDGLQGNVFNPSVYFKSANGQIFFGGMNGLTFFSPDQMKFSDFNPQIEITSIKIKDDNGGIVDINPSQNQIELEPDQNTLIINFASLDFTNAEKNQYKYKLSGYYNEWTLAGSTNSVTFSKLKYGVYQFEVMGTNSDGVWSENIASFNFTIQPHFWQTWWFIPSLVLGFSLIGFLIHLVILKTKVKRVAEIARIREEESDRVRKKTAIDFHDELGHRLTRISLLTEIVKRKIGFTFSEIQPLLNQISENSSKLYNGTKDFIWAIDPKKDSLYELVVRLKDFGDEIFNSSDINFNVEGISEELQKASLDMDWKRHLMLIFKEGMNNSLKHSKSKKVSLTSNIKDDEFELVLEDDGVGFVSDTKSKGNGLKNMKQRAENLNADIQIESHPGSGTKLSLKGKFPIKSVNFN